jgi:hypothetical protein
MASILNVDQINNAAGTSAITIDASTGKASFPNSVTIPNGATMPAGSVVQVVQNNSFGDSSTSSSSFTDTNMALSITPSASSSKIIVLVTVVGRVDGSGSTIRGGYRIVRTVGGSATTVVNTAGSLEHLQSRATPTELSGVNHYSYLDSPATTSAVEYKVQMALNPDTGASAVRARYSTYGSNFMLLEIAG